MSGKRLIKRALKNIAAEQKAEHDAAMREILATGRTGPNYHAGLASEGYVGGYRQALNDCLNAMDGVTPDTRGWWDKK